MSLRDCCSCNNINAHYTIKSLTSIIRQNTFYLPLCNHSLKITPNPLFLNMLRWLQMPRFICNHLQPSATLVLPILWNGELPFAAQAAFQLHKQAQACKLRWQMSKHLSPYLQPL